jgi:hypothetical protein
MVDYDRLYAKIITKISDADIPFSSLCRLLEKLGFDQRIRGDHHLFTRNDIEEILNLQPKGSKGKPYQVKQVRQVLLRYRITLENSNEQ